MAKFHGMVCELHFSKWYKMPELMAEGKAMLDHLKVMGKGGLPAETSVSPAHPTPRRLGLSFDSATLSPSHRQSHIQQNPF